MKGKAGGGSVVESCFARPSRQANLRKSNIEELVASMVRTSGSVKRDTDNERETLDR
jgi:hypothetical protein